MRAGLQCRKATTTFMYWKQKRSNTFTNHEACLCA
jgi:hypothetical protein